MKRRLPIGIQDFAKIRDGNNYVYADKTACIHQLITGSEGRRKLFKGLAIDSLEWEWKKHPVIRIDLNPGNYTEGAERWCRVSF